MAVGRMRPPAMFRRMAQELTRPRWPVPREQVIPARDMILPIDPEDVLVRRSVPGYPGPVETLPIGPPAQQRITPGPVTTLPIGPPGQERITPGRVRTQPIGPPGQQRYMGGYYGNYWPWSWLRRRGYGYSAYTPPWERTFGTRPEWAPWRYRGWGF